MGELRNDYEYTINDITLHVSYGGKRRTGLTPEEYKELITETCKSWRDKGITWLRNRFGNAYMGHLGILGTAIMACYARQRCYDFILEPSITTMPSTHIPLTSINPDIALIIENKLLILEIKLHHKEVTNLTSQIDEFIAEFKSELRRLRIHMGVLHMLMTRTTQAREERRNKPRWLTELILASKKQQDIYNEIDNIIKDLIH